MTIETNNVVERLEVYRDIFAEITAKAQPECADPNDPERVTSYWIPVGPIHRAAGKLGFQMFDGEAHMQRLLTERQSLSDRIDVADELWVAMIQRGTLVGGQFIVVAVEDTNQLIAALRARTQNTPDSQRGE